MAQVSAAMVKELREMTGAGMMECKKALVEADGDMDKAVDVLRTAGLASVAKKAGRATNEGAVVALVSDDAHAGALVELNCETDFVGMNEKFKAYAEKLGRAALAANAADVEACAPPPSRASPSRTSSPTPSTCWARTSSSPVPPPSRRRHRSYIHGGGKIGVW